MAKRSEDIQRAIDNWGAERTYFLTLTLRHHPGMAFAVLQKLVTYAYGRIWSGRKGQKLAEELGGPLGPTRAQRKQLPPDLNCYVPGPKRKGKKWRAQKPHSIRAHDRTWSLENGFHPHLHCLLFLHEQVEESRLWELLHARWAECLEQTLTTFYKVSAAALDNPEKRSRCEKVFGMKLFPKTRTVSYSARLLRQNLKKISLKDLLPNKTRGVQVELVRDAKAAPKYLAKLGCELSSMFSKQGKKHFDERLQREIEHFGMWQLGQLAADPHHDLHKPARRAWKTLYEAVRGTQTLTFSTGAREALGLDDVRDEDIAQEGSLSPEEDKREAGEIEGAEWDKLLAILGQELLSWIYNAHARGKLHELAFVTKAIGTAAMWSENTKKPKEQRPEWWQKLGREVQAELGRITSIEQVQIERQPLPEWAIRITRKRRIKGPPENVKERRLRQTYEEKMLMREEIRHRLFELGVIGPAPVKARAAPEPQATVVNGPP